MNYINDTEHMKNVARTIEELRIKISHMKEDFEREVEMGTPVAGWDGKNAEARDAAKAAWINANNACNALRTDVRNGEIKLATLMGELAAFELERRDREWRIRQDLVGAIRERGISEALPF